MCIFFLVAPTETKKTTKNNKYHGVDHDEKHKIGGRMMTLASKEKTTTIAAYSENNNIK